MPTKPSLLDELYEEQQKQTPNRCGVQRALDQLPKDEQVALTEALAKDVSEIGHNVISKVLDRRNIKVSDGSIGKHRRGRCNCGKS